MTRPNAERAYAVLDHIKANPELWRQEIYIAETDCGRVACFAGWTVILFGKGAAESLPTASSGYHSYAYRWVLPNGVQMTVDDYADLLLGDATTWGVGPDGDDNLFAAGNTMDEIERMVAEIFGPRPVAA